MGNDKMTEVEVCKKFNLSPSFMRGFVRKYRIHRVHADDKKTYLYEEKDVVRAINRYKTINGRLPGRKKRKQ